MQQEYWIANRAMLQRLLPLHPEEPNRNWRTGLVAQSAGLRNGSNACVKRLHAVRVSCWANQWVTKRLIRKLTYR